MENRNKIIFEAGKVYVVNGRKWDTIKVLEVKVTDTGKWVTYHYAGKNRKAKVINVGGNNHYSEWFKGGYNGLEKQVYASDVKEEEKWLITLAETQEEALSDFLGYKETEHGFAVDENSICRFRYFKEHLNGDVFNIVSFDNGLPNEDDMDGWYAVRCA